MSDQRTRSNPNRRRRSSESQLDESMGPASMKDRCHGIHVRDTSDITADPLPSGSSTSHGPSVPSQNETTHIHAGPSTSSHPMNGSLFPPSAFPRVRPPAPPKKSYQRKAKPLQRDTNRLRTNPDTGELEIFDYESTQEHQDRLRQDHYNIFVQVPMVCDFETDLKTMSELDGPHFTFDRDVWRDFEDDTLIS